jgi:cell division protein FtsB
VPFLKKKYYAYGLVFLFVAILLFAWLNFGRNGLAELYKMQKEKERCLSVLRDLREANEHLSAEIRRLRGDPKYLESVARKELGLVRENEIIYRFKSESKGETRGDEHKQ